MELRAFKVNLRTGHIRAVLCDTRGLQGRDLVGPAFERARVALAAGLARVEELSPGSALRALSVDGVARVLRATFDVSGQPRPTARRLDGDAFEALAPALTAGARRIVGELTPPRRALDLADNAAWGALYRLGGDGWELGRPAPPLVDHFARNPPRGRALVVGCGRGHEARLLASHGVTVVAIDVASEAIAAARAIGEAGVTFRQADLFAVPDELGAFDLVVEHCCFCAIPPERRGDYVEAVANTLRRDGRYVGLFRDHGDPMGPPYAISPDEVASRFAPRFVLEAALPARGSVLTRAGHEFIAQLRLR